MSATSKRVPGHELLREGAPFSESGYLTRYGGTSGEGRGKCSCGAYSPMLPSGAARKRWHREHKAYFADDDATAGEHTKIGAQQ